MSDSGVVFSKGKNERERTSLAREGQKRKILQWKKLNHAYPRRKEGRRSRSLESVEVYFDKFFCFYFLSLSVNERVKKRGCHFHREAVKDGGESG